MSPRHKYIRSNSWLERALLIQYVHMFKTYKYKEEWNVRKTAAYFRISVGQVSEGLRIAAKKDQVKSCSTRQEALEMVKK